MQDKQPKKKKGLTILLLIIAAYIVVVSSIALYVKLDNNRQLTSEEELIPDRIEVPKVKIEATADENLSVITDENKTVNGVTEDIVQTKPSIDIEDEDDFEREYAKYLGSSLADVPARPLDKSGEEVLIASDLTHEIEVSKGFFARMIDSIYDFFAGSDEQSKNLSKESASMLAEIDGEIGEMQSHFSLYKESNGVTYIDHLNKPMVLESNGFYIYIGVAPNGFTFHRTIIRYSGVDEIDLQSILVQTSSTDKAFIIEASEGVLQKKMTTAANEWVDLPPTQENNTLLNSVVSSGNVKVTFMGAKKNIEWLLTDNEMITLMESLHFYKLLKEKEELSR